MVLGRYTREQLFLAMQSKLQAPVSFLRYDANQGCPVPSSNIPKNVAKYTWLTPDVISVFLAGCRTLPSMQWKLCSLLSACSQRSLLVCRNSTVKATPEAVLQTERRTELRQCNLSISRKNISRTMISGTSDGDIQDRVQDARHIVRMGGAARWLTWMVATFAFGILLPFAS